MSSSFEALDAFVSRLARGHPLPPPVPVSALPAEEVSVRRVTYDRLLVGIDEAGAADDAFDVARRISEATGAHVEIAHASPEIKTPLIIGGEAGVAPAGSPSFLTEAITLLADAGIDASASMLKGEPPHALVERAEATEADLIVVGSHSPGAVQRLVLGSVSDAVKNHASCSVFVARTRSPMTRVLVGVDGSVESRVAVAHAHALAAAFGSELFVLHIAQVAATTGVQGLQVAEEGRFLEAAFDAREIEGVPTTFRVLAGLSAGDMLTRFATANTCDPVVVGTKGLGLGRRAFIGSVAERTAHRAKASVMITR